jgi:hypothetical protein
MSDPTPMKPPQRLLDDASVEAELQEGLAELAASEVPFDGVAGLAALKVALEGAADAGAAASSVSAAAASITPWIAGSLAVALLGSGLYAFWPEPPRAAVVERAQPARVEVPAPVPELAPPPVPARVAPAPEPKVELTPAASVAPSNASTPIEREVALTVRAKSLIDDNPRAALALLRKLDREHPSGALNEERAGLRVLALWQAGDRARATSERDAFLARYPESPQRERLARLGEAER